MHSEKYLESFSDFKDVSLKMKKEQNWKKRIERLLNVNFSANSSKWFS